MILFVTRKDDVHADWVLQEAEEMGGTCFRLNTEAIEEYEITLVPSGGRIANTKTGKKLDLSDVSSVYLRRRSIPENLVVDEDFSTFCEAEWKDFTNNLWATLDNSFWVSSSEAIELASQKIRQLKYAEEIGLSVPETLFTNNATEVAALQKNNTSCIYKPFGSGTMVRSSGKALYTNIIDTKIVPTPEQTESIRVCPGIFQPYVNKKFEVRATVVGKRVFPAKIDSQKSERSSIDWRRYDFDKVDHSEIELPKNVEQKCVELVTKFGLMFGAIDFIVTNDDKYVFLEINANGQWAWIQMLTKQNIAKEIASLLVNQVNL